MSPARRLRRLARGRSSTAGNSGRRPLPPMEALHGSGLDLAELATFLQAWTRRWPGAPAGDAPTGRLRIQVVTHHQIEMPWRSRWVGQTGRGAPCGEQALYRVQCPDGLWWGGKPLTPQGDLPRTRSGSSAVAPGLVGERRPGTTSTPAAAVGAAVVLGEPVGGLMPATRDRTGRRPGVSAALPRPARGRDEQRRQHRCPPPPAGRPRVGEGTIHTGRDAPPGNGSGPSRWTTPRGYRNADHRFQLVHVAQRRAAGVEELLDGMGHRRSEPPE